MRQQMNRECIPIPQERNALQSKGRSSSSPTDPYDFDSKRDAPPDAADFAATAASRQATIVSILASPWHGTATMS
jgi:hypothetical protein